MNRAELATRLRSEQVRPDSYDLTAAGMDEAYVLRPTASGWEVFYAERGHETARETFTSESAACEHLLALIERDQIAKVR